MRQFFQRSHPWLMQALGGLIALIAFIPIAVIVWINVINAPSSTPTTQTAAALTSPTPSSSGPPASTAIVGGTGAVAHPVWTNVHAIFVANCTPCHISSNPFFGGLDLNTYASALKGGSTAAGGPVNGAVIKPGDANGSYMYQVITGKQQPQMPLGRTPLPAADIQTIFNWIQQGAKQ